MRAIKHLFLYGQALFCSTLIYIHDNEAPILNESIIWIFVDISPIIGSYLWHVMLRVLIYDDNNISTLSIIASISSE